MFIDRSLIETGKKSRAISVTAHKKDYQPDKVQPSARFRRKLVGRRKTLRDIFKSKTMKMSTRCTEPVRLNLVWLSHVLALKQIPKSVDTHRGWKILNNPCLATPEVVGGSYL